MNATTDRQVLKYPPGRDSVRRRFWSQCFLHRAIASVETRPKLALFLRLGRIPSYIKIRESKGPWIEDLVTTHSVQV